MAIIEKTMVHIWMLNQWIILLSGIWRLNMYVLWTLDWKVIEWPVGHDKSYQIEDDTHNDPFSRCITLSFNTINSPIQTFKMWIRLFINNIHHWSRIINSKNLSSAILLIIYCWLLDSLFYLFIHFFNDSIK